MDTAAYYVALAIILAVPAALSVWFVVHPLAPWWRRVGAVGTYVVVALVVAAIVWGIYLVREPLLRIRFGVRMPLVVAAVALFGIGAYMRAQVNRRLSASTILGLPEVSPERGAGRLVTDGIYSRLRHPRYVGMGLGVAAAALFSNYLATYIMVAAYVPVIYLVVLLEERELSGRFGAAYRRYCQEVPRFFPRLARRRT